MNYMGVSPKVYSKMYDRAQDIGSSKKINDFSIQDITKALDLLTFEYSKSVETGWHLVAPDIEDAMNTALERDMIHNITKHLEDYKVGFDSANLLALDKKWQDQLLGYIADGEVSTPHYPNEDKPQNKWWFHIEELDKLSDKDRATL